MTTSRVEFGDVYVVGRGSDNASDINLPFFADDFESGNTSAWSNVVP